MKELILLMKLLSIKMISMKS